MITITFIITYYIFYIQYDERLYVLTNFIIVGQIFHLTEQYFYRNINLI